MANRKSQSTHDKLVEKAAISLTENPDFMDIRADVSGYISPKKINWRGDKHGHIPDLTAVGVKTSNKFIFEVETEDSIDDDHTESQWRLFSAFNKQNGGVFYVVVPKKVKDAAELRLSELDLEGKVWGI